MIRIANFFDCSKLVKLHLRCLPYSLNSKLGTKHLESLYKSLLGTEDSKVLISEENGNLRGFISGFVNYGEVLRRTQATLSISFILNIAKELIKKPLIILDILDTVWITSTIRRRASNNSIGYISTWGVAPEYQGSTIGLQLFGQMTKYLKESGSRKILIDVRKSNNRVFEFYARTGYKVIERTLLSVIMEREY